MPRLSRQLALSGRIVASLWIAWTWIGGCAPLRVATPIPTNTPAPAASRAPGPLAAPSLPPGRLPPWCHHQPSRRPMVVKSLDSG